MSKCIIITGMHRSGTSLFTHYLSEGGIELGDNLLSADRGNPKGYFEDKKIIELHNDILRDNGCHYFFNIRNLPSFEIKNIFYKRAEKIIQFKKKSDTDWGWKDPRTSLFLNFWTELIDSEIKYIFLFRHPISVYDSLKRRGTDSIIKEEPIIGLRSWILYNKKLLSFYDIHKKHILLINIDSFLNNLERYRTFLNEKLEVGITDQACKIIDKELIAKQNEVNSLHPIKFRHPVLFTKSMLIYNKMLGLETFDQYRA